MGIEPACLAGWPTILRSYLVVSIAAHLIWEILQLPLYTLWSKGTFPKIVFAVVHCTIGDVMIAGLSLLVALATVATSRWPAAGVTRVWVASLAMGVSYTIFSEWLNTRVRESWGYSELMPLVPVIGTGLAPLLQWIVVPTLAMWIAVGRKPWGRDNDFVSVR
jgi:hypothetical protein